jgi:hypothetical protein
MSKPNGDKMMTHYINIENGVLKLMRMMPERLTYTNPKEYEKLLAQAKADSVEIAPKDKIIVVENLPATAIENLNPLKLRDGIYEITTNGVFEVRHKGFFNGGKVEWVRGHAPTNDYEELAYYKEEAKPEQPEAETQHPSQDEWLNKIIPTIKRSLMEQDKDKFKLIDGKWFDENGVEYYEANGMMWRSHFWPFSREQQPEAESQEAMWEEYKVWNEEERKKRFTVTKTITRNKH